MRSMDRTVQMRKAYMKQSQIRQARFNARRDILKHGLPFPIGYYRNNVPGSIGNLFFVWRIILANSARSDTRQAQTVLAASLQLRKLLSREQSLVYSKVIRATGQSRGKLGAASAHALLEVFGFSRLKPTAQDDSRIARALVHIMGISSDTCLTQEDSVKSLAEDFRDHNSTATSGKLSKFFEAGRLFLDSAVASTGARVDQRRAAECQGSEMYMPIAMSIPDLMHRIKNYAETVVGLKMDTDFILPSHEWLRLQFQPQRADALQAARFTGRLGLHRVMQSRTIRSDHEDCHFVRALWQYVRQWSYPLAMGRHAMLISVDDKCGVKVGELGMPITAVQRHSKKSIHVYDGKGKKGQTLAADHDFSTVTLTPSVTLFIDLPTDPLGYYCRGAPYLSIKNAVFQSSNPFRHAVEMMYSIRDRYQQKTVPPVLVVFSDGGTDNKTNLYSVQLSFLWLMVELDLDEVICVRTAPGDSWVNPEERRMADLNIAREGASFSRSSCNECEGIRPDHLRWFDKHMKSISSMNGIRKLEEHEDTISNSIDIPALLNASVQPIIAAMTDSVSRLQSSVNETWKVLPAATEKQTIAAIQFLRTEVCPQLDIGHMQASAVEGTEAEKILNSHNVESSRYIFQLRKRLTSHSTSCISKCPVCALKQRLPNIISQQLSHIPFPVMASGGRYAPFESSYGKAGAENLPAAARRCLAPRSHKENTSGTLCRGMIECSNCGKSRGIYSRYKGHFNEAQDLLDASTEVHIWHCVSIR